jgi:hypothetical protein
MKTQNRHKRLQDFLKSNNQPLFFVLIVGILGFFTHLKFIRSEWTMNPDESELIATARLAAMPGGLNSNYTTSTYGPIWPEFLAILNHLGMTLNHSNAHLLAFIMKMFIFLTPQCIAISKMRLSRLILVLIPINIALFLPSTTEFAFLSTELLPLALLTFAVIVILRMNYQIYPVVAGVLFTTALLSKYQSLLMFVILLGFIFLRSIREGVIDRKHLFSAVAKLVLSIVSSLCVFTIILVQSNSFQKFFGESFLLSAKYSTGGEYGGGANILSKIVVGSNLLLEQPIIMCVPFLILIIAINSNFLDQRLASLNGKLSYDKIVFFIFSVFISVGFLTVFIPGNKFPHYLLFFVWTLVMYLLAFAEVSRIFSASHRSANDFQSALKKSHFVISVAIILAINSSSSLAGPIKDLMDSPMTISKDDSRHSALESSEVLQYCPKGSQVLVWGWSAELFAHYDWLPAPDVVNDVARMKIGILSENTKIRITKAISSQETKCIFEAIGSQYFGGFDLSQGVVSLFPNALEGVLQTYRSHELVDGTKVWSREN